MHREVMLTRLRRTRLAPGDRRRAARHARAATMTGFPSEPEE
ncbi:MAG: hypothetical protein ACOC2D_16750 [Spirochaetota bacterium]